MRVGRFERGLVPMPSEVDSIGRHRRDTHYRRALGLADVLSAVIAVTVGIQLIEDNHLRAGAILALPLVVLVSKVAGLYDRDELLVNKTTLDEAPTLFQAATLYTLLIWLFDSVMVDGPVGNKQVLVLWVLIFAAMALCRAVARRLVRPITAPEACLVVGGEESAARLSAKLSEASRLGARVVGRVPLEPEAASHNDGVTPVLGQLDTLGLVLAEHDVDRVIIAPAGADQDTLLDTIRLVKTLGVKVSVLPRLCEVVGSSVEFDNIDGLTLLGVRRFGLSTSSRFLKRSMDIALAGAGLLVFAPLLAAISVSIRLTSSGPALFRQARIGRNGRQFDILKFRTMAADADAQKTELRHLNEVEGLFKISSDPRVTRIGRVLRRACLDELPQLWNVLKGEMSLVGPRPLIPDEDQRIEGLHRRRLQLVPGMTGFWQISGRVRLPLTEMVTIDYLYGANWSLWGDLKILLRTVPYVLARRGL